MARPKNIDNMSYQEALDAATLLNVAEEGDDIYALREKIRIARESEVQPPTTGELIQAAVAEDEEGERKKEWKFADEKKRLDKALKPFIDNGMKVSYGDEWYNTTFNHHTESNHITTPTVTVRRMAAMQMQARDYERFGSARA